MVLLSAGTLASTPDPAVPLVVDLDGTLLRTDTLVESLFAAARHHPLRMLALLWWLAHGRAVLKQRLAALAQLDVQTLPCTADFLGYLRMQHRLGRHLVLASGADRRIAQGVADGLGLFDAVIASDGQVNLSGASKRDRLVAEFGRQGYDYAGNGARDLVVWAQARRAVLVNAPPAVVAAAARSTPVEGVFGDERATVATYLGAMRYTHWLKNLLVFVPLLAEHRLHELLPLGRTLLAMLCFCLAASGVYLINDLFDLAADRRHPHKKSRALASGRLPVLHALLLAPAMWGSAALLTLWLAPRFAAVLAAYVVLNFAYSIRLKDIVVVDALALAAGYTLRIVGGAVTAGGALPSTLLMCSATLFFGLALLKRFAELVALGPSHGLALRVHGYRPADAGWLVGLGLVAGSIAVALLALYALREGSAATVLLALTLLAWTAHMWRMGQRGRIHDDPVTFALRDPPSRALGLWTLVLLAWLQ